MSSKILGGLRTSIGAALLAGGLLAAGAGVAQAAHHAGPTDGKAASVARPVGTAGKARPAAERQPIKKPDRGPVDPVTIGGAKAGNDAAVTVTPDESSVVVSGRGHAESPMEDASGGVVHHDDADSPLERGVGFDTMPFGLAGGATGDESSMDAVGTARIGVEKRYYAQH